MTRPETAEPLPRSRFRPLWLLELRGGRRPEPPAPGPLRVLAVLLSVAGLALLMSTLTGSGEGSLTTSAGTLDSRGSIAVLGASLMLAGRLTVLPDRRVWIVLLALAATTIAWSLAVSESAGSGVLGVLVLLLPSTLRFHGLRRPRVSVE